MELVRSEEDRQSEVCVMAEKLPQDVVQGRAEEESWFEGCACPAGVAGLQDEEGQR